MKGNNNHSKFLLLYSHSLTSLTSLLPPIQAAAWGIPASASRLASWWGTAPRPLGPSEASTFVLRGTWNPILPLSSWARPWSPSFPI